MRKLSKLVFISFATLLTVGLAGCTSSSEDTASSESSSSSVSSSSTISSSSTSVHRTTERTMALATYYWMLKNNQLDQLNGDIDPIAYNVTGDAASNNIKFTAGTEQNDHYTSKTNVTVTDSTVSYSGDKSKIEIKDLYNHYFKEEKFRIFLDDFDVQDNDDNDYDFDDHDGDDDFDD